MLMGGGISHEEIFARQLAEKTGRVVYKRGRSNTSTNFMYRQLIDENFVLEVPDAEYAIYVWLRYHGQRNVRYTSSLHSSPDLRYKINKKGDVTEIRPFLTLPFYISFTVKNIQDHIAAYITEKEKIKGEPLLLKLLEKSYSELKKKYPNIKFIFLEYPDGTYSLPAEMQYEENLKNRNLPQDVIDQITDLGIIYVNAEELVGHELRDLEKYRHTDMEHPNGQAWKEMSIALTEKFNL